MNIWSCHSPVSSLLWIAPSLKACSRRVFCAMQDPFWAGIPSLHHLTFYSWAKPNHCYFCEYTSLSQIFCLTYAVPYDKNNLSPAWLPKDFDFLWGQVILRKIPTFFRRCIRNSKQMLLLLSLTSGFYSSFNCMPHCSSLLESYCVALSLLITILFTIRNI